MKVSRSCYLRLIGCYLSIYLRYLPRYVGGTQVEVQQSEGWKLTPRTGSSEAKRLRILETKMVWRGLCRLLGDQRAEIAAETRPWQPDARFDSRKVADDVIKVSTLLSRLTQSLQLLTLSVHWKL
jgi:hypothetical protein